MFEMVKAGGWLMFPIIGCSIIALGIILERFWSLQSKKVIPKHLVATIWHWVKEGQLERSKIESLGKKSALGKILAAGLNNRHLERQRIKESIEETGRQVVHEMERFLNTLGTIAAISPLLGLLGTVIGMIKVFNAITSSGVGNAAPLAGGISQALITTAAGLSVAIIALMFHRYFRGRVDEIVVKMEEEAIKMVDVLHNNRTSETSASKTEKAA
ncbi:MAG: MotA/TolQ/ExbB proton channel family protein [Gammaproteobacteria bacterium]|nr:MotA/TolQ/ExbB proton channel family protein [Gammaproteobacteria bacterium]MCW8911426.1 MotA/TolQ/ExbB proton channel family protein [Gammaproteobacteria bacterium]MCW9003999.1 MotA/TolQ/ExbB proton channel family protein [Gammaproteobacteria bacterium]MCW9055707.1 MotA/TolQ/ExbB proton channel family protein [Gammaproteobacteria bacterium]